MESPEIVQTLERELRNGLKTLQQRKQEQEQWDKALSQRELALAARDADMAKLEAENQALKVAYEKQVHANKLGEEVKRFLAQEGKQLAETLSELMLVRRLGPNRLEHLNLLARQLHELRNQIFGQHKPVAAWRAPPQLMGLHGSSSNPDLNRSLVPPPRSFPGVTNSPLAKPQPRRVQSAAAARTKARLVPPPAAHDGLSALQSVTGASHPSLIAEPQPQISWEPQQLGLRNQLRALEDALAEAESKRAEAEQERTKLKSEHAKLSGEVDSLQMERAASNDSISLLRGQLSGERDRRKEHVDRAREEIAVHFEQQARDARVELLRRQIVRRILHRSLARGWTSWVELWQARVFALDWLRRAGNTFRRTDVSRSFYRWREEWQELHHKRSLATRDAAAESITAVLCRQFTKKLLRQEIARAWASWRELRWARHHAYRLLKRAANHLRHPFLAAGFYIWIRHIDQKLKVAAMTEREKREFALESERTKLDAELKRVRSQCEQQLARADEKLREALENQRIELTGLANESAAARERNQRDARIEQLRVRWARRLRNQQLARALMSWTELWEARTRALSLLHNAARNLRSPQLAMGFNEWIAFLHLREDKARARKELGLRGERDALDTALKKLRDESDSKLAAAAAERAALEKKIDQLGDAAAVAEAALEARKAIERAERARLISRQISRRIRYRSVTLGFTTWVGFAEMRADMRNRLRSMAGRLRRPRLGRAFHTWVAESDHRKHQAQVKALEENFKREAQRSKESLEGQLRQSRFEAGQLEMLRVSQDDELRALKEKVRVMAEAAVAKNASLSAAAQLEADYKSLHEKRRLLEKSLVAAEQGRRDAEATLARQSASNQDLLERLLAEQRMSFESQQENLKREAELAQIEIGRQRRDLEQLHDLRTTLEKELIALESRVASQKDEYEGRIAQLEEAQQRQRDEYEAQLEKLRVR